MQTVRTSRGILKYSTERANANELGGTMQTSERRVTNERSSKFFGSTTVQIYVGGDFELIRHAPVMAMRRQSLKR
jgi:hypothetical protein